jgi:predicted regulator of Ras-like GTPase activity (Roadblock/LC7/MglB family)
MVTRQSELIRVLGGLAKDLPSPHWVALVDENGLIMSCVPSEPEIDTDRISAMAAASVQMGERVLNEIDGGRMRFLSISGARRQVLTLLMRDNHLLSIGMSADVATQSTFAPLSQWVPEVLRVLDRRFGAER